MDVWWAYYKAGELNHLMRRDEYVRWGWYHYFTTPTFSGHVAISTVGDTTLVQSFITRDLHI